MTHSEPSVQFPPLTPERSRTERIATLCGGRRTADNSDLAWLWETCPPCNREAYRLAAPPLELQHRVLDGLRRI